MTKIETARIRGIGDLNGTPPVFGWGCKYKDSSPISDWIGYSSYGEHSMKADLYYYGPAVTNIYVDPLFYGYRGSPDVYNLRHVDSVPDEYIDSLHAVAIIGWGVDPEPHWVIQNSWGPYWGSGGFVKVPIRSITAQYSWKHDPYSVSDTVMVVAWACATVVSIITFLMTSKQLWHEMKCNEKK
jgi:hypothetical protein